MVSLVIMGSKVIPGRLYLISQSLSFGRFKQKTFFPRTIHKHNPFPHIAHICIFPPSPSPSIISHFPRSSPICILGLYNSNRPVSFSHTLFSFDPISSQLAEDYTDNRVFSSLSRKIQFVFIHSSRAAIQPAA